jgi:hypothetical protein
VIDESLGRVNETSQGNFQKNHILAEVAILCRESHDALDTATSGITMSNSFKKISPEHRFRGFSAGC